MTDNPYISVIIPVYNEEDNITELYGQLSSVLYSLNQPFEVLFIDDGSRDNTYNKLKEIKDDNVRIIRFQRNFGKAAALSCGFKYARSNIVITMDGDLQDDPKEIAKFLEGLKEFDMVSGWKYRRKDPFTKTIPSKIFNILTRVLTNVNIHDFNCGFKAYRGYVVKDIKLYGELHRYIPAIAQWKGYTVGEIKVEHHPRVHGKSKYGANRLLKGFLDLITVKFLITYIQRPLHLFGSIGVLLSGSGFLVGCYLIYLWFNEVKIGDRPLLNLSVLLIITGIQLIAMGLIGELFVNSKDNNNWIIKKE
ncbi:glycosyltransferase [Methanocella sp. CWC-04]|uniref:Glycosyltransferase n=1 Tax=Methanooceanicella nereidis TaxID=2052831 RepID=A0AAP2REZ5_9EURY|nr:glycosyltransferase family 2 protein [Methanocella sp. CWC-04]MCD1296103.1 glycosyltransferase [Methanocella sp. CWC-04]